jgi:ABC-type uncharacterized transport system ATPase component
MIVIGSKGAGKSSILNTLSGLQGKFNVNSSEQNERLEPTSEILLWRGS